MDTVSIFFIQLRAVTHAAQGPRHQSVRAWVGATSEPEAVATARATLDARGYSIESLDAVAVTTRADYFPPCDGLNAFLRAERDGACYRFEPSGEN